MPCFRDLQENPIFLRESGMLGARKGWSVYQLLLGGLNGFILVLTIPILIYMCCLMGLGLPLALFMFGLQFYGSHGCERLGQTRYLREEWMSGRLEPLLLSQLTTHEIIWGILGARIYRGTSQALWFILWFILTNSVYQSMMMSQTNGIEFWLAIMLQLVIGALSLIPILFLIIFFVVTGMAINQRMHLKMGTASAGESAGIFLVHTIHLLGALLIFVLPWLFLGYGYLFVVVFLITIFANTLGNWVDWTVMDYAFTIFGAAFLVFVGLALLFLYLYILYMVMQSFVEQLKRDCGKDFEAMLDGFRTNSLGRGQSGVFGEK